MAAVQQMFGTKCIFIFSQKHVSGERMMHTFTAAILIWRINLGLVKKKTKKKRGKDARKTRQESVCALKVGEIRNLTET